MLFHPIGTCFTDQHLAMHSPVHKPIVHKAIIAATTTASSIALVLRQSVETPGRDDCTYLQDKTLWLFVTSFYAHGLLCISAPARTE